MRYRHGTFVAAAVLLAPLAAMAGEPNPEVAKVLKEIEARRAEKEEAHAKAPRVQDLTRRELQALDKVVKAMPANADNAVKQNEKQEK